VPGCGVRTGIGEDEYAGVRAASTAAELARATEFARDVVLFRRGGGAGATDWCRGLSIREIGGGCGVCGGSVLTLLSFRGGSIGAVLVVGVTGADDAIMGDDGGRAMRLGRGGFLVAGPSALVRFVADRDAHDEAAAIKAPFGANVVGLGGGDGFALENALVAPNNAGLETREDESDTESCECKVVPLPLPLATGVWPFMEFDGEFS
jgi:hypothetical protein